MAYPSIPEDSFPPARNNPCFCGSARRFKHCCGNQSAPRDPPHGVRVVENFLTTAEAAEVVAQARQLTGARFTLPDGRGGTVPDEQRVTEWVDFRSHRQALLDDIVARAFAEHIIPATGGQSIAWYEEPQVLRYQPGGYYLNHSDAYQFVPPDNAWRKVVDRDISMLIYLNDKFEGGQLSFKRLFYRLQPRTGMLVWFPSDMRYEHMALPVTAGQRYVLVSWAALAGIERVQAQTADRAILWPSREKFCR